MFDKILVATDRVKVADETVLTAIHLLVGRLKYFHFSPEAAFGWGRRIEYPFLRTACISKG